LLFIGKTYFSLMITSISLGIRIRLTRVDDVTDDMVVFNL